ncbi:ABC transporter permease [Bifidobacterium eulemuris]|uniref:ABC transporter permease n=1 Tax=Bifidobacterium eulemuris TaxID=1765219 RepID=A0A261GEL4_9BIFI|nr:FtsX-like permease family protein [Bifidobacterium eulemuris]OZG69366.1 ABC transporter permease [Bifidobacterium eulemuris]QOL31145.1 FtsX-like permease family protein [Bifidobacterium eulemuris]
MFSITLKLMKKSARMLIPAGIAILIGTAFIAATFLFGNAMDSSLRTQLTAQLGGANYFASPKSDRSEAEAESLYSMTVADLQLDRIRAIDGVNDVRADVSVTMQVNHGSKHASILAVGTAKETKILPVDITEGDQPIDNNEIALPQSVAEQLGVRVGDTITVDGGDHRVQSDELDVRVVGLTDDPNGAFSYYGGAAVASNNVIAAVWGYDDFSQINASMLMLDLDETKADAALADIAKLLPSALTTESRQSYSDRAMENLTNNGTDITTMFLLGFGVLAMLVAALVIANTFQVLVAQRRRTLALLRTIGAKKGQLYASVLFEAGVLGFVASLLGIALGIGLMAVVCRSNAMNVLIGTKAELVVTWPVFAVPLAFGIVMTVLASLGSARTATSVTPLEALRPIELTDMRRSSMARGLLGGLMVVAGTAMTVAALWQMHGLLATSSEMDDGYTPVLLLAIAGCALVFVGMVVTAVFWLPLLIKAFGALVSLAGPSAKVAHANIQKNPRRVAATGAALLIGVTLVSTIVTGAASGKQTMDETLSTRYSTDVVATGDISQSTREAIAKVDGVASVVYAPTSTGTITDANGHETTVLLVGIESKAQVANVVRADLSDAVIDEHTALMPEYSSAGTHLVFDGGQRIELTDEEGATTGTTLDLGITQSDYRRVSSMYGAVAFVSDALFDDGDITEQGHMTLMRIEEGDRSLNDIFTELQNVLSDEEGVSLTGPVAERTQWNGIIDSMMAMLVGLLAVAVLIALIGVANTLSLSVIERTRESATLRAIGMTRGQLRRSLAVEALLISVVSGMAGIALGTLFGWAGSYMVFSIVGETVFPFDWATNGIVLLVAAVAALLASVFPARRAVKTPPVEALAEA